MVAYYVIMGLMALVVLGFALLGPIFALRYRELWSRTGLRRTRGTPRW